VSSPRVIIFLKFLQHSRNSQSCVFFFTLKQGTNPYHPNLFTALPVFVKRLIRSCRNFFSHFTPSMPKNPFFRRGFYVFFFWYTGPTGAFYPPFCTRLFPSNSPQRAQLLRFSEALSFYMQVLCFPPQGGGGLPIFPPVFLSVQFYSSENRSYFDK